MNVNPGINLLSDSLYGTPILAGGDFEMGENLGNYGGNIGGGQQVDPNMDPDLAMVRNNEKYVYRFKYNELPLLEILRLKIDYRTKLTLNILGAKNFFGRRQRTPKKTERRRRCTLK